jgi:hypothetical protein
MAVYLYGFVRADTELPAGLTGVGGEPIEVVAHRDVAALVGNVTGDKAKGSKDDLLAHAHALETLASNSTVLPMQFGVVLEGSQQIRENLLEPINDRLLEMLHRFEDRVELVVKAFYVSDVVLREILATHPKIERLRERTRNLPEAATYYDRIELGEQVQGALERKGREDEKAILDALSPLSEDVHREEAAVHMMAAHMSFLIDRKSLANFMQRVDELQDQLGEGLILKVVGPLPPYTFAAGSLPVGNAV